MKENEDIAYSRALVLKHNTLYKIIIAILLILIFAVATFYFVFVNVNKENKENIDLVYPSGDLASYYKQDTNPTREVGIAQMKIDYINNCNFSICYPEVGIEEIDESILSHAKDLKRSFIESYNSEDENADIFYEHVDYRSYIDPSNTMRLVFVDCITNSDGIILTQKEYTHVYDLTNGDELTSYHKIEDTASKVSILEPLDGEDVSSFVFLYSGDVLKFATTAVNIRKEQSTNSEIIGTLNEKDPIEVRSGDDNWETVLYNGEVGYVKAGYLSRKKNLHKEIELEILDRGIDPNKPMVAITFDDGPNPNSTPRILDTLEQYNVVATFFDLGQLVNTYPDIVRREESIGCEVGSHTYSHKNLNILNDDEIKDEITNAQEAFKKALGHEVLLMRAPYGNANLKVKENTNYPIIKWNIDSLDWKTRNKTKILNQINKTTNFDGNIILLHSIYGATADAVEELIPQLLNKGYQLVTVSELAYYKGYTSLLTAEEYKQFRSK
ncbi:MAG: polysaccharide deacetylase family protein [Clostridia bacterium]|nr:polysaccharide deacetylase family protein [Clostridia bacterium]